MGTIKAKFEVEDKPVSKLKIGAWIATGVIVAAFMIITVVHLNKIDNALENVALVNYVKN